MNAAKDSRYAVYWAPEPQLLLAQVGQQWLGQDASLAPVAEPALYGFHATLKPPFHLSEGVSEAELLAAVQTLAAAQRRFEMPALEVARLHDFLALRPQRPLMPEHALWRLANACVEVLDRFRRPASEAELVKRRAAELDPEQQALLQRWGYPHVLGRWRFHMTLTNSLFRPPMHGIEEVGEEAMALQAGLQDSLQAHLQALFAPALAQRLWCDSICVFQQDAHSQPFRLAHRFELGARAAESGDSERRPQRGQFLPD